MTRISRMEASRLLARETFPDWEFGRDRFQVFVPGTIENRSNADKRQWKITMRYRKTWRKRIEQTVGVWLVGKGWIHGAKVLKRVTLLAHTWNEYDRAGLAEALKPIEDGLVDAGVIHDDKPSQGHRITQEQKILRRQRGVLITVEVA